MTDRLAAVRLQRVEREGDQQLQSGQVPAVRWRPLSKEVASEVGQAHLATGNKLTRRPLPAGIASEGG